jgi:hypothetical protein
LARWASQYHAYFCGPASPFQDQIQDPTLVLLARARYAPLSESLRSWLNKHFGLHTGGAKFEEGFSALHKVTLHYQELNLPKVQQVLGAELARAGEHVEFFELRFPQSVIAVWSPVIIAAIHLYFLLHLHALPFRPPPGQTEVHVGWIGLYPQPLAGLVTLFTISVVPLVVTIYLFVQGARLFLEGQGGGLLRVGGLIIFAAIEGGLCVLSPLVFLIKRKHAKQMFS